MNDAIEIELKFNGFGWLVVNRGPSQQVSAAHFSQRTQAMDYIASMVGSSLSAVELAKVALVGTSLSDLYQHISAA